MTNEEIEHKIMEADRQYDMLKDRVHDLYEENKQLKDDKKKAIEYINNKNNWYVDIGIITKVYIEKEKLLEILGDKE